MIPLKGELGVKRESGVANLVWRGPFLFLTI